MAVASFKVKYDLVDVTLISVISGATKYTSAFNFGVLCQAPVWTATPPNKDNVMSSNPNTAYANEYDFTPSSSPYYSIPSVQSVCPLTVMLFDATTGLQITS